MKKRKLFCEISPACYEISLRKEYLIRDIKDLFGNDRFASEINKVPLPVIVKSHRSRIMRELHGVDMELQRNKAVNLRLAGDKIDGIIINPGETFSFWRLVGEPSEKKGYLDGLVIKSGKLEKGTGGGLCQLAAVGDIYVPAFRVFFYRKRNGRFLVAVKCDLVCEFDIAVHVF